MQNLTSEQRCELKMVRLFIFSSKSKEVADCVIRFFISDRNFQKTDRKIPGQYKRALQPKKAPWQEIPRRKNMVWVKILLVSWFLTLKGGSDVRVSQPIKPIISLLFSECLCSLNLSVYSSSFSKVSLFVKRAFQRLHKWTILIEYSLILRSYVKLKSFLVDGLAD